MLGGGMDPVSGGGVPSAQGAPFAQSTMVGSMEGCPPVSGGGTPNPTTLGGVRGSPVSGGGAPDPMMFGGGVGGCPLVFGGGVPSVQVAPVTLGGGLGGCPPVCDGIGVPSAPGSGAPMTLSGSAVSGGPS